MSEEEFSFETPDADADALPASGNGMILSRSALSKALRMDVKTIDSFIRDGAPVLERGDAARRTAHKIDLAAFVRWWLARDVAKAKSKVKIVGDEEEAFDEEKRREKSAAADLKELQVAKLRGELVSLADVEQFENQVATLFRSQASALFTQVRDLSPDQTQDFKDAVNAMLTSLTKFTPSPSDFDDVDSTD